MCGAALAWHIISGLCFLVLLMQGYSYTVSYTHLLSGIQPTGTPTLRNYIGAVRNWALLQPDYDCLYMVADLHACLLYTSRCV